MSRQYKQQVDQGILKELHVRASLDRTRKDAEGRYPAVVTYDWQGYTYQCETGYSLLPKEWHGRSGLPIRLHPLYAEICDRIQRIREEILRRPTPEAEELQVDESLTGLIPNCRWVLDERVADDSGYCPVVLEQVQGEEVSYMPSGISLRREDWDAERGLPLAGVPNRELMADYLSRKRNETIEGYRTASLMDSICFKPGLSLVLRSNRMLSDGSYPLMVGYYQRGGYCYRATGVSLFEADWDELKGEPKPDCAVFNRCKELVLSVYKTFARDIETERPSEWNLFVNEGYSNEGYPLCVGPFIQLVIDGLTAQERYGNASVYRQCMRGLYRVFPSLDIPFSNVTIDTVNQICDLMKADGCMDNSIVHILKTLRAIYNRAVSAGVAEKGLSPFKEFSFRTLNRRTEHRALSKDEVLRIIQQRASCGEDKMRLLSLDVFTFSYLCGGIPIYDLCLLSWDNIRGGMLEYVRQKTHGKIRVAIPELAMEIVEHYRGVSKGYLFPMLDAERQTTVLGQREAIQHWSGVVNKHLRAVGVELDLSIPLTTYVARHSFATVLQQEGISIDVISEALGHQSQKVTKVYLAGLSHKQMVDLQGKLA